MDNALDYLLQMFALQEPRAFPLSKQRLKRVSSSSSPRGPGQRLEKATSPTCSQSDFWGEVPAQPKCTPGLVRGGQGTSTEHESSGLHCAVEMGLRQEDAGMQRWGKGWGAEVGRVGGWGGWEG